MSHRNRLVSVCVVLLLLLAAGMEKSAQATASRGAVNPNAPSTPVRLIFIHHSTGENWLTDDNGGLGVALRDNNYFVSDTNYGWGPPDADVGSETIGDHTDIGHYWNWFRGPNRDAYLAALFAESEQHSSYSRLETDPGGENRIILFKSCFPNSNISGNPSDPPTLGDNPLRGESAGSEYQTVGNIKGIYNDLLVYFATRPDKLFVLIVSPPLSEASTDAARAANARAVANWLANDWLAGYPYKNVAVFDFYNVLTTNGGNSNTNDLNQASGNHHRWWQGAVQHKTDGDDDSSPNYSEYPSVYELIDPPNIDDHPSQAGNLKATAEFVPLLNYFYSRWLAGTSLNQLYLPAVLGNH